MRYYSSLLLMLSIFWSCSNISNTNGTEETAYFPFKDFVEVQIPKLEGKSVYKVININGKKETSQITPTQEEWMKDLDSFLQVDINKPALSGAYETQKSEKYLIHELKEGEKGKIKKIVVQYEGGEVKQISFISKTENPFYSSQSRGVLMFDGETGEIFQYSLENIQEIIFSKPNKMIVNASVE
ncbi:hypothetical protein ACFSKV_02670 [Shivajiella indica]|uniref:Uncharacterized protein n=2 Tax=Shivajiella indica TaxID=872115 RepID=A0ABW5B3P2_9BACT